MLHRFMFAACFFLPAAIFLSIGCERPTKNRQIPTIRVATDGRDDNPLLDALNGPLQGLFPSRIQIQPNDLPINVRLVEDGKTDLAVVPVNVAYLAYTHGWSGLPRPHTKLRGIAALYTIPLHLIARKTNSIQSWTDIRGRSIAIGTLDSTTQVTVTMVLESLGIPLADIDAHWVNGDAAVRELRAGSVDAVFHRGNDPPATISKLLQIPGARMVPISRHAVERMRALHPFLHPIVIPSRTYGNHPDISTIGVDSLVVCREDLPEELVYSITRAVFELLAGSPRLTRGFQRVDLRRIQASPIPLHPGAARYFRERELFQ